MLLDDVPAEHRRVVHPCLSPDGTELFFVASVDGSPDADIYVATRKNLTDEFGSARRLNDHVNSSQPEAHVALHPDGCTLIFSSMRQDGLGSFDLWAARRASVGLPFGKPVPLHRVNSTKSETAPCITPDGETLYFLSKDTTDSGAVFYRIPYSADLFTPRLATAPKEANVGVAGARSTKSSQ
jgi:Tol biopolymer transport system component